MFNPYFARGIGSERFERHVATIEMKNRIAMDEIREMFEDMPREIHAHLGRIKMRPEDRGWALLAFAVRAQGYIEYMEEWLEATRRGYEDGHGNGQFPYWRLKITRIELAVADSGDEEEIAVYEAIYRKYCSPWSGMDLRKRAWELEGAIRRARLCLAWMTHGISAKEVVSQMEKERNRRR